MPILYLKVLMLVRGAVCSFV